MASPIYTKVSKGPSLLILSSRFPSDFVSLPAGIFVCRGEFCLKMINLVINQKGVRRVSE